MNGYIQIILTIFGSVIASSGFWAYINKKSDKDTYATQMLIGLGHDRIVYLGMKYLEMGDWVTQDEYENLVEYLYKPYSKLGGICFVSIGLINEFYDWELLLPHQMLYATLIITLLEFVFGVILNIKLGLNIWDYSNLRFNILGQISLEYMFLWFWLSFPAILLDDWLRYRLFNEEKPYYKITKGGKTW